MFSGIVETTATVEAVEPKSFALRLNIRKPSIFDDLKSGDSVAVDGVCLTVESFNQNIMVFTVAAETLQVTRWNHSELLGRRVNLERSLRLGDRIHGHLVAGHVDGVGSVASVECLGESLLVQVALPETVLPFVWRKGSLALNGVSLTVNELSENRVKVCLIPETQKRTNLADLKAGDSVNVEADSMARAMVRANELDF